MKLLRVCVAVVVAAVAFFGAGCNDGSGPVGPNTGTTGTGSQSLNTEWKMLKDGSSDVSLVGTSWKLQWVGDIQRAEPAPNLPDNYQWPDRYAVPASEKSYTLEFRTDGTIHTFSSVNEYWGTYTVESASSAEYVSYKINFADFVGTKVGGGGVGDDLWSEAFPKVDRIHSNGSSLILFYTDENGVLGVTQMGLIFKPLNGSSGDVLPNQSGMGTCDTPGHCDGENIPMRSGGDVLPNQSGMGTCDTPGHCDGENIPMRSGVDR